MKKIFILLGTLFFVACNDPVVCTIEQTTNSGIAAELQTLAGCSNTAAITSQLQTWEAPLNLCPASGALKSGAATDICLALIPIVEQAGSGEKYLSAWGCNLTQASSLTALLTKACGLLAPQVSITKK